MKMGIGATVILRWRVCFSFFEEEAVMADLYRIASMLLEHKTYSAITTAVGCSRRDVAQVKKLLDDHGVADRGGIPPGLFDELA